MVGLSFLGSDFLRAMTTNMDGIARRGGRDMLDSVRRCLGYRFAGLEAQGEDFVHMGMEVSRGRDFSATVAEKMFAEALQPIPTTPESRASPRHQPKMGEIRMRQ